MRCANTFGRVCVSTDSSVWKPWPRNFIFTKSRSHSYIKAIYARWRSQERNTCLCVLFASSSPWVERQINFVYKVLVRITARCILLGRCIPIFICLQEEYLVQFCLVTLSTTAVCYGKGNATTARALVSITITIIWLGYCWLSVPSARCLTSCVVWSPGVFIRTSSANATFCKQVSNVHRRTGKPEMVQPEIVMNWHVTSLKKCMTRLEVSNT